MFMLCSSIWIRTLRQLIRVIVSIVELLGLLWSMSKLMKGASVSVRLQLLLMIGYSGDREVRELSGTYTIAATRKCRRAEQ